MQRIIMALAITFLIVFSITVLVDFVEGSRNYGENENMSAIDVVSLTLLKVPKLIEDTIPFIVLFGVMGALNGLNKSHELVMMRSIGLSAWKILRPMLYVTTSLGVLWALLFNPTASRLIAQHDSLRESFNPNPKPQNQTIWLREGNDRSQTIIRADRIHLPSQALYEATFYQLSLDSSSRTAFSRRYDADIAKLTSQNSWLLENVVENIPGQLKKEYDTLSLPTSIRQDQLLSKDDNSQPPAFWSLPNAIKVQDTSGFSTLSLRMQFHKLLALPILLIAMTLIAAAVSMNLSRSGGTLRLLIAGAVIGFTVYFGNSVMHTFGEAGTLPVILSAWFTPLFIIALSLIYLSKTEDG
jgi:lipopolysaccharide export system permease protein